MIKMIAAVCRRPGMTHAECVAYHQQIHGAIAREQPVTLRQYVQNHVFDSAFGSKDTEAYLQTVARDTVTELFWDDLPSMGATFAHPYTQQRVGPDGPNFSDTSTAVSLVAQEVELPVPNPGAGGVKVLHFLRSPEDIDLPTFFTRWTAAHELAMAAIPDAAKAIRRAVQNRQLPEANASLAYFGSKVAPFEGVATLSFDNESTIGLFRAYEAALLRINSDPRTTFYAPESSFFLYTREVRII